MARRLAGGVVTVVALTCAARAEAAPSSTSTEQGYNLGEAPHPRSLGMAGASEVWGGSTTALFVNPANLPLYRVYHIEGLAAFGPEARRQTYGGAVVDSSTSRFAGGLAGTWSQMDPDGIDRQWTDVRLGVAYPLSDRFSLGVTGRYLRVNQGNGKGPFGPGITDGGLSGSPMLSEFSFDAGLAVALSEQFRLAISGRNLTAPGTALMPVAAAGGLGWSNQVVTAEADVLVDFTTFGAARMRTMEGLEILFAERFPIRAGYRYDAGTRTHGVCFGGGYVDHRFSVELGLQRDVAGDHPATTISVGLRIFIDAGMTNSTGENTGESP
jgi:hypothetical protein